MIINNRYKEPLLTTGLTQTEKEYINFDNLLYIECEKYKDTPTRNATLITGQLLNIK